MTVTVSPRGASRWAAGHPWIYRTDTRLPQGIASGAIVPVQDERGPLSRPGLRVAAVEDHAAPDLPV